MAGNAIRWLTTGVATFICVLGSVSVAQSGTIRIEPVLVDVAAPRAAATMKTRNDDPRPANVQIRVFRWLQVDGEERLTPTDDVVASPPAVTLAPHTDYTIRVVRVSTAPLEREEGYRILIDQIPSPASRSSDTVNLLIRQSIPAFFGPPRSGRPDVRWSLSVQGDDLVLSGRNDGDTYLRVAALKLEASNGKIVSFGDGLVGYVLSHSTMRWIAAGKGRGFSAAGSATLTAVGNLEPIHASVPISN